MLRVGLTGGIGSGKSIVCKVFFMLGIPVYQADIAAKKLYDTDFKLRDELKLLFGEHLYNADGMLDRQKLAGIIFSDKESLEKVNRLVHPAVRRNFLEYVSGLSETTPYVIHEAAILYESKLENMFDRVINVQAPENIRIKRILSREATSEKDVKQRIAVQWPDELKIELSDYNIINDDKTLILPQILQIHRELNYFRLQTKACFGNV
ncbi:MAG: dephospho-CoA kinase [Prevotellaceae bacterium]|jgi:dephospho-CoA kinase|nr:dephospho-CoA kinase [Prevotellaceae bacterium]